MANNYTDYAENKINTHVFGTGSFTKPAALYIGLSTTTITDAGVLTIANNAIKYRLGVDILDSAGKRYFHAILV